MTDTLEFFTCNMLDDPRFMRPLLQMSPLILAPESSLRHVVQTRFVAPQAVRRIVGYGATGFIQRRFIPGPDVAAEARIVALDDNAYRDAAENLQRTAVTAQGVGNEHSIVPASPHEFEYLLERMQGWFGSYSWRLFYDLIGDTGLLRSPPSAQKQWQLSIDKSCASTIARQAYTTVAVSHNENGPRLVMHYHVLERYGMDEWKLHAPSCVEEGAAYWHPHGYAVHCSRFMTSDEKEFEDCVAKWERGQQENQSGRGKGPSPYRIFNEFPTREEWTAYVRSAYPHTFA